ncbi:hypothetical protein [Microbulbifer hydrolyticus]|uniref:Cardiolipin synthase N-terminal domain-containing protein n=1 Tax=Microbulbifer hydrolyticus TaxID=48074 RepID=A0A6P1T9W0_9GAMM|nr:hypothetical protein [Microbulbifer hydrolyticus]MBB5213320.1 hypothetical protein [Microbulbifer hydrolyticus]QHQ38611.1 hypothetical protein GTQ55_06155 [Microbulbifer hydrolyticus]
MSEILVVAVVISEFISLYLIGRLWRSNEYPLIKILVSLIAFIPVLGPLLYVFVTDSTPPQPTENQNRKGYGGYTQKWINERGFWKRAIQERENKSKECAKNT